MNNKEIVGVAMEIGRDCVTEVKTRAVMGEMGQNEYVSFLAATLGYLAVELAAEAMRQHRDQKSDMGAIAAKIQVGIVMDGVYRAVEAADKSGKDLGPSYPANAAKVP
jgi:hypothetical protein